MPNSFFEKFKRPTYALGTEKFRHTNPLPDLISKLPSWPPSFSPYSLKIYATLLFGLILISSLVAGFVIVGRSAPKPPKILKSATNSLYLYETKNKDFSAKIGSKESTAPSVSFTVPSGANATFSLVGSESKTSEQKGNTVIYPTVFSDTSVTYTPLPTGLKEEIILDKPVYKAEYTFNLVTTAHPRIITNDFYSPFFFDDQNKYQFHLEKPFAVDAKGKRTEDVSLSLRKSKIKKDTYQILITVSPEWLKAKDRAYPVTIDPTIVHDISTEFATGVLNRVKDIGAIPPPLATGGTITYSGGYTIHTFTGDGTFTPSTSISVEYLVVGGGGGGGNGTAASGSGGGGGAGGLRTATGFAVTPQAYTVTVGGGGAANTNGSDSVFSTITSIGGGHGGSSTVGTTGGSGGGSVYGSGGAGTVGQGNNGGVNSGSAAGGGGGGAGAVGTSGSAGNYSTGLSGGAGSTSSITGSSVTYAGGGGGGGYGSGASYSSGGAGGAGGGGAGGGNGGTAGTLNTGGGGGGGGAGDSVSSSGGAGGSGIVVIRYLNSQVSNLETTYQELPADQYTVGLWHMNEGSDNTCSGGQDACDSSGNGNHGIFTGNAAFTTTRRLGSYGTTYDGSGDYINAGNGTSLQIRNQITLEAWIKTSYTAGYQAIVRKDDATNRNYGMEVAITTGTVGGSVFIGNVAKTNAGTTKVADGNWHHVAQVYDGSYLYTYVDGNLDAAPTAATGLIDNDTVNLTIGDYGVAAYPFNGQIDEVRVSNIARTPEQIKSDASRRPYSVFTSDVIDFTIPVATWNPLLWTELGVTTGDGETLKNSTSLVAQWNFNETSGSTADNAETTAALDGTLTNFGAANACLDTQDDVTAGCETSGWSANNKRWGGGALMFDGTNDFVSVADNAAFSFGSGDATIELWVNSRDTNTQLGIFGQEGATGYPANFLENYLNKFRWVERKASGGNADIIDLYSTTIIQPGRWYYVALTKTGSTYSMYLNGKLDNTATNATATEDIATAFYIGARSATSPEYFKGTIDSMRVYKGRAISAAEVMNNYQAGNIELQTRVGSDTTPDDGSWEAWKPTTSETVIDNLDNPLDIATPSASIFTGALISTSSATFPLAEGSAALKLQAGRATSLTNTVALWHLDETSGTGAYLKDSSTNANHLTPTGSFTTQGFFGKARTFSGGSEYLNNTSLSPTLSADLTIQTWFKTGTTPNVQDRIIDLYQTAARGLQLCMSTTGTVGIDNGGGPTSAVFSTATYIDNKWHHFAVTRSGTTYTIYVDGASIGTSGGTAPTYPKIFFARLFDNESSNWAGSLDETKLSNVALSAEEIAEAYRAGRDHYLNKTIASSDFSGKTSLPFYVAADRPGTYLTATVGESAFANYQPDASTLGLWHLDEQSGSGAYVKDSSGNGRNGTPSGTNYSQGIIGKARSFATGEDISLGSQSMVDGLANVTVDAWVYPTAQTAATHFRLFSEEAVLYVGQQASTVSFYMGSGAAWVNTSDNMGTLLLNQWSHVVWVKSGTTGSVYINGTLSATMTAPSTLGTTANVNYISTWNGTNQNWVGGLDEVRISNAARTATEIRQAYEYGLRTHPITIDFASAISHTNTLSSSADLSFTLMATPSGTTNAGDNIFKGDKIIVRENYNGTEYLAQGTVDSVNVSTGTTTVSSWDASSTFPSVGFSPNAQVFKWQREYWNLDGEAPDNSLDAITNLTLRLTDGNEGRTIWLDDLRSSSGYLTTPTGSTIASSTGYRYGQYRVVNMSTDEAVSATVSAVTLDYVLNVVPNVPTLDLPTDTSFVSSLTPILKTTATDTNSDYLRYKIQLCTDLAMTTACQTFDQTSSQTGWSGQDTQTSTAYASGTQAVYTIQTPLTANTTYYWRSYAIDPAGVNSFGATQGTPFSFTTNSSPAIPTLDFPADTATGVPSLAVLKTTTTDDNADYLRYKIELCTNLAMTVGCQTFNQVSSQTGWSGQNTQTSTAYTSGTQGVYTLQTPLSPGTQYYWRSYAIDPAGSNSFGSTQVTPYSFTTNASPAIPTLDLPANFTTGTLLLPTLKTTTTDADADYLKYKIDLCTDVGMTANCQTFNQYTSQTGWSGQNTQTSTAYTSGTQGVYTLQTSLTANTTYFWLSYARDPGGSDAFGATQASPISFTTNVVPAVPSLDLPADAATGQSVTPILKTTGSDIDSDYLRYKIKICTNLNMSLNCQTFDQTSSQTGWSGQDTQTSTAYASGTQATYTIQSALLANTEYFWYTYAIDPAGTNTFSSPANTPRSFTTLGSPTQASTCTVQKNNTNTQMVLHWTDNSSAESGYQVWKVTDGGAPVHLTPDLAANATGYTDSAVTTGHTYGYLIRSFSYDGANTLYSTWCPTATSNLNTGGFRIF